MRLQIWVRKANSFEEAQKYDDSYYLSLSASERIETVQFLREEYKKLNKGSNYESGERLRRVFKLIKQT
ncbi:MAG: hypothetical protein ACOC5F_03575 [Candidatus Aminicenantaceae bacterium]